MSAMRREIGAAALGEARLWLGTPYRHQASLRGIGCDCLGLLRGVWRGLYGAEPEVPPPYSAAWAESAAPGTDPLAEAASRHLVPVPGRLAAAAPRAGDVLLFAFRRHLPARHCAIATGDGAMIHAHDGAVVTEVALTGWWRRHLTGVFRFPEIGLRRCSDAQFHLQPGREEHRDERVDGEEIDLAAHQI
jgi:NlpC/P60 family putative phage cell wall peptidase